MVAELREEAGEALTFAAIAERLNAAGYRTARGKAFGRATVHRLLSGGPTRASAVPFEPRVLTEAERESLRNEMSDSIDAMRAR